MADRVFEAAKDRIEDMTWPSVGSGRLVVHLMTAYDADPPREHRRFVGRPIAGLAKLIDTLADWIESLAWKKKDFVVISWSELDALNTNIDDIKGVHDVSRGKPFDIEWGESGVIAIQDANEDYT